MFALGGQDEQRLLVLAAWRERALLQRARAGGVGVAINGWKRLAVGLRTPVGDYVSPVRADAGAPA